MDGRRRQWFPCDAYVAVGKTGTYLKQRFGRDGVLVWVCYLAACKRNWVQGQFTYSSDVEGWQGLGLYPFQPEFTLDEFFTATGRIHQTTRRRSGTRIDVIAEHWDEWNTTIRRQADAERKARARAQNIGDSPRTLDGHSPDGTADKKRTDSDSDSDSDFESEAPPTPPSNGGDRMKLTRRQLGSYTGVRIVRGTHGTSYIYDPLGTASPPADWPHGKPTRQEIEQTLREQEASA